MAVDFKPEHYHTITPYLCVKDAGEAIEFYKEVLGAVELFRIDGPGGTVAHAEIKIGDSLVMVSDEWPEYGYKGPHSYGGSPVGLMVYVPDVDERFAKAVAGGAVVKKPVADQFYGDRSGSFADPFGHVWTLGTHIEDVSPEEMRRRADAWTQSQAA